MTSGVQGRLILPRTEDIHNFVDRLPIEIVNLGRGSGYIIIVVVSSRVSGPYNEVNLL